MEKAIRIYKPDGSHEDVGTPLTLGEISKRLDGYCEVHTVGEVTIFCDEDGKMKGLQPTGRLGSSIFVGDLYVGKMTDEGLDPVPEIYLHRFEEVFCRPAL